MDNKNIFTVSITGAGGEVRDYVSDCVLVIAHKLDAEESDNFDMSLNGSTSGETMFKLLQAIDQTKQQILDSDEELKKIYNVSQTLLAQEE